MNDQYTGRIVIELRADVVPMTAGMIFKLYIKKQKKTSSQAYALLFFKIKVTLINFVENCVLVQFLNKMISFVFRKYLKYLSKVILKLFKTQRT